MNISDVLSLMLGKHIQVQNSSLQIDQVHISGEFTPVQIEFIEFTLDEYIVDGVQELAVKKMRNLVELSSLRHHK
ncbi:hypothetical protein F3S07_11170 [Vibrio alginolyticus]|nr:hypothetical protein [Vibrio alginolyticus]